MFFQIMHKFHLKLIQRLHSWFFFKKCRIDFCEAAENAENCLNRSHKHYNDCSLKFFVILTSDLWYMHFDGEEMKETILIHTTSPVKQLYLQV